MTFPGVTLLRGFNRGWWGAPRMLVLHPTLHHTSTRACSQVPDPAGRLVQPGYLPQLPPGVPGSSCLLVRRGLAWPSTRDSPHRYAEERGVAPLLLACNNRHMYHLLLLGLKNNAGAVPLLHFSCCASSMQNHRTQWRAERPGGHRGDSPPCDPYHSAKWANGLALA